MEKAGSGLVVSYHDLEGTPDDLDGLYARDGGAGRGHREDRGHARAPSPTWAGCWPSPRAWPRRGRHAPDRASPWARWASITRWWPAATARPSRSRRAAAGAEAAPGQIPAAQMADLYRVRNVTPATRVYGVLGPDVRAQPLARASTTAPSRRAALDAVVRAPAGRGARAVPARRCPRSASPASASPGPTRSRSCRTSHEVEEPAAALRQREHRGRARRARCAAPPPTARACWARCKKRIDVKGRAVVIVGAGGAARAAALALRRKGARVDAARARPGKAAEVAAAVGCAHGAARRTCRALPLGRPDQRHAGGLGGAARSRRRCPRDLHRAGHGRLRHGLRPAGDAAAARGAGRGLHDHRRPGDAAGAGRRAVRGLDGPGGARGGHEVGRALPGAGAGQRRERARYSRQELFAGIGPEGQARIRAARVVVVGLRGAGLGRSPR